LGQQGDNVEEMLMSGKNKAWRLYVKRQTGYSVEALHERYPQIPKEEF